MSTWVWRDVSSEYRANAIFIDRRLKVNDYQHRLNAQLSDCVDYIAEQMDGSSSEHFVIVAHSGGGILAPLVVKRFPQRCAAIMFVCANIPKSGNNSMSELPGLIRLINRLAVKRQLRVNSFPAKRMEKNIRKMFCNTCREDVIEYVLKQDLLPEPFCVITEKVDWADMPQIRMVYVRLLKDKTASLDLQDRMASNLSITEKYDIDSDHMVMLSHAKEFNDVMRRVNSAL